MQANIETTNRFMMERRANGITPRTQRLDKTILKRLDQYLEKPFEDATKEDMIGFVNDISGFKKGSIHIYKRKIKLFYNWLFSMDPSEYPPAVSWMRGSNPATQSAKRSGLNLPIKPEEILSREEITALINACEHPRDQALVSLIYDTGSRAEEALRMKVAAIQFDQNGGIATLDGPTGARRIRIIESVPYLQAWLNVHPRREDPAAPLWLSRRTRAGDEGINYAGLYRLFQVLKRKCPEIKKPVRPHLLRHARLTELAKYMTEQKLKVFAGWTPGSHMAGVYVHLSGRDLDEDLLNIYGKGETEKSTIQIERQSCPRCGFENVKDADFCVKCNLPLSKYVKDELTKAREEIASLTVWVKELEEKMEKLGIASIHIEMPKDLAEDFEKAAKKSGFKDRHEAIEKIIEEYIKAKKKKSGT